MKLDEKYKYTALVGRPKEQVELLKEIVGDDNCQCLGTVGSWVTVAPNWVSGFVYWPTDEQLAAYEGRTEQNYEDIVRDVVVADKQGVIIRDKSGEAYCDEGVSEDGKYYTAIEYEFDLPNGETETAKWPVMWLSNNRIWNYKKGYKNPKLIAAKRARYVRFKGDCE